MKHNMFNFKADDVKEGRNHKHKADDKYSGGNWKSKFIKSIKIHKDLKPITFIMATEEQTNQSLISALSVSSSKLPGPS